MDFGRSTIAPDRLLRCVVLKHLKGWSFRGLEEELRANLLYRRFTRFYEDPIPDHTVFSRLFRSVREPKGRRLFMHRWSLGPERFALPRATACARTRPRWRPTSTIPATVRFWPTLCEF